MWGPGDILQGVGRMKRDIWDSEILHTFYSIDFIYLLLEPYRHKIDDTLYLELKKYRRILGKQAEKINGWEIGSYPNIDHPTLVQAQKVLMAAEQEYQKHRTIIKQSKITEWVK